MGKPWGQPEVPPAEKDLGKIVTRFNGYIDSQTTTAKGEIKLTLMVQRPEKYKALLAVDSQHTMLHFEVYESTTQEIEHDIMEILEMEE